MKLYEYIVPAIFRAFWGEDTPNAFPTQMPSSPSFSTTTTSVETGRYDVFLSFRGEDTRNGFTSHLYEALCSKQILTFIDNKLQRGGDISPSLLTVIQESAISVIVFSENYADSRWCLKELAKIIQCKHSGQIVIPVFYGVDPSHVKKQIGNFGVGFGKLKTRLREGEMDLNEVRSHLEEAATTSGWNSHDIRPESKLIKSIVGDILNKLNGMRLNLPSSLVGIDSNVEQVETLLCLESPRFRIVGLWGMSGIGKTTVAQTVYHRICTRFDGFYFVEKVSEKLKNQSVDDLRKNMVLKLFEEESLDMGSRTLHLDFTMKQLQRKKVLIVLDDVDNPIEAKKLLMGGNDNLFHGSSRILVTSKDKQVLKNIVGDENLIYEVDGLNEEEGLQVFSLCAFKQNHPTSDFVELSNKVLSYARGNPLALVSIGHALFDKSYKEWESVLDGLEKDPFLDIEKVFRISYNALSDEEKMHDLLKEMIRSFESTKKLQERTRIWDFKDVPRIFERIKESSVIEEISQNISEVREMESRMFSRLDDLINPALDECKERLHISEVREMESRVFSRLDDLINPALDECKERFEGFREKFRLKWDKY